MLRPVMTQIKQSCCPNARVSANHRRNATRPSANTRAAKVSLDGSPRCVEFAKGLLRRAIRTKAALPRHWTHGSLA